MNLVEICEAYGFEVKTKTVKGWCSSWTEHHVTGHGLVEAKAFERDMPLAANVAEAGVVVKTGENVGYVLYPERATLWQPWGGVDSVFQAETMPEPLDDPRWSGPSNQEAQVAHDAKIIAGDSAIGAAIAGS